MVPDELEVYLTPDGLGRASIVRRSDGLLCIYVIWLWPETFELAHFAKAGRTGWATEPAILSLLYEEPLLYEGRKPEAGLYGTLDDARRQVRGLRRFSDASVIASRP